MQLGICMGTPSAGLARRVADEGCAYYEPAVAAALMAADAETFDADLDAWTVDGLAPRSANVLLPGSLPVVGEAPDTEGLERYLTEAMRRARALGLEVVVFGSGGARRVPEGFPPDEARRQFGQALRLAARAAGEGPVVCAEHLRRAETNLVNTLAEAAALVQEVGTDGHLALVVDIYHLSEEQEPFSVVDEVAGLIRHVHVCGAAGRRAPEPGDEAFLGPLFERLAAIGYDGRCSIECRWDDLDRQAPVALGVVRRAAEASGLAV